VDSDTRESPNNVACYSSDLFSFGGTFIPLAVMTFVQWGGCESVVISIPGGNKHVYVTVRVDDHDVHDLAGADDPASGEWRFEVVHIQNSTLASGVVMRICIKLHLEDYFADRAIWCVPNDF